MMDLLLDAISWVIVLATLGAFVWAIVFLSRETLDAWREFRQG